MQPTHARKESRGFTLLEILLVVAAIGILASIVIVAINPSKQLAETRNAQRKADVNTILNAVYQYAIDENGQMPFTSNGSPVEICASGVVSSTCTSGGLVFLGELTDGETYLTLLPTDPQGATLTNGTGYTIATTSGNRVRVIAPKAELDETIQVTR